MDLRQPNGSRHNANPASNSSNSTTNVVSLPSRPRVPAAGQAASMTTSTAPHPPVSAPRQILPGVIPQSQILPPSRPPLFPAQVGFVPSVSSTTTYTVDEFTTKEFSEETSSSKSSSHTVTTVTEEINSELFSLVRTEINGSSQHFLESTLTGLHDDLEALLRQWKEEKLYVTLDKWIKSRIAQHVKKIEKTAITHSEETHRKDIKE